VKNHHVAISIISSSPFQKGAKGEQTSEGEGGRDEKGGKCAKEKKWRDNRIFSLAILAIGRNSVSR